MARRRRSKSDDRFGRERPNVVASVDTLPRTNLNLSLFEDRRDFNPLQDYAPAGVFSYQAPRHVVVKKARTRAATVQELLPSGLQFADASGVVVCVRRKRRREVLFAKKKHGRNGARKYRRNRFSEISC